MDPSIQPTIGSQGQTNQPVGQAPTGSAVNPALASPAANESIPTKSKSNPNSTQNTLHISEIRDGIVIMNDGSFRAVVMCKSINFDLMSPQERDGVELAFQGFLNMLYFPVQITIRSQRVDLRPYLEKLDKIRSEHENMLLALLMEDYIAFISDTASQANIMDKRFYVVIPYFPVANAGAVAKASRNFISNIFGNKTDHVTINEDALEKAKAELRNYTQAVVSGLAQTGVRAVPLDTQELIEVYYDAYNPDTSTRQQLKNFDDLTAPVITKGVGEAPRPNLDKGTM